MKTLGFDKTSSSLKPIKVLHILKGISCNQDYSASKKSMFYRGLCWNRERENDLHTDGPGGLADTLRQMSSPRSWRHIFQNDLTESYLALCKMGHGIISLPW